MPTRSRASDFTAATAENFFAFLFFATLPRRLLPFTVLDF